MRLDRGKGDCRCSGVHSLVARGVHGDHVRKTEVPLEFRVQEGHHKAAGCSVHVDLDVPAVLLI